MTPTTDPPTVTPAQEAITAAMLATFLACAATSYLVIQHLQVSDPIGYIVLTISTFVVAGYLVPNLTAIWFGRSLDDIMDPDTTPLDADDLAH